MGAPETQEAGTGGASVIHGTADERATRVIGTSDTSKYICTSHLYARSNTKFVHGFRNTYTYQRTCISSLRIVLVWLRNLAFRALNHNGCFPRMVCQNLLGTQVV